MRTALFAIFALGAAALGLAACGGGGGSNPPAPGPTCAPPSGTQTALVYPAPNATAVPDQVGKVIIGASPALPSSWNVVLASSVTAPAPGGTFAAATPPFPTPNATPAFVNPVYQSSSFGSLIFPSGVVFQVYLNNTGSNCTPMGPIASFTTL